MPIRVKKSFRRLVARPLVEARAFREIGAFVVQQIRTRTEGGRDVNGYPFRRLSPRYAEQKAKALGSTAANLSVSGRMLNALTVTDVTEKSVTVGFADTGASGKARGTFIQRSQAISARDKARWHNETGAGQAGVIREFIGLSKKDQTTIVQMLRDAVGRALRRSA